MGLIYEYIKSITLLTIFLALLEMILPSMKFTKYIKLVLGFVLMVNIILPFVDFKKYNLDLKDISQINFNDDKFDYTPYVEASSNIDNQAVSNALKSDIESSFQSEKYAIKDIEVNYEINGDNFEFTDIHIVLEEKSNSIKNNSTKSDLETKDQDSSFIRIETIEVGGIKKDVEISESTSEDIPEINDLKNKINLEYNVPIASIYVKILNN